MGFDNVNVNVSGPIQPTSTYKTKVLKGNHSFASQITEPNMKYVIKHDFVLDGDVTIPANCVLEFDGGSISGGNINANDTIIQSSNKCFSNITFSGNIIHNYFHTSWFTKPSMVKDNNVDNTTELQQALNSGIKKLIFDFGWYHISSTLTVNGDIQLFTDNVEEELLDRQIRGVNQPVIWTADVATMLDYNYVSEATRTSLTIGSICFRCEKTFTTVTEESANTPIINIVSNMTGGRGLWGVNVYASISAMARYLNGNYRVNYTGIRFYANDGYIAFAKTFGTITDTYNAVISDKKSGQWFNGVEIYGHTCCVKGIDTTKSGILIVHGEHQCCAADEIFGTSAYFVSNTVYMFGYVYDINHSGDPHAAVEAIGCTYVGNPIYNPVYANKRYIGDKSCNLYNLYEKIYHNILTLIKSGDNDVSSIIKDYSITLNGENILESSNNFTVYNKDNLFYDDFCNNGELMSGNGRKHSDESYILLNSASAENVLKIGITIDKDHLLDCYAYENILYFNERLAVGNANYYIKLKTADTYSADKSSWNLYKNFQLTRDDCNYASNVTPIYIIDGSSRYIYMEFELVFTTNRSNIPFPFIFLTTRKKLRNINSLNNNFRLPTIATGQRKGFGYYDITLNKYIWWDGTQWVDATGTPV